MISFPNPQIVWLNALGRFLTDSRYHLLGWLIFIFYDAVLGGIARGIFGTLENYIVHYTINISLFYLHSYLFLKIMSGKNIPKAWFFAFLLATELSVYLVVTGIVDNLLHRFTHILSNGPLVIDKQLIFAYVWRGMYFIFFSTGYCFFLNYKRNRDLREAMQMKDLERQVAKETIEKELTQAKNSFLLAQVNPHFLFNTLNYIYYTCYKTSPDGAKAIMALAKIMRYSADSKNTQEMVMLKNEIEHIETLIQLHLMRYEEQIRFNFNYSQQAANTRVIPLLLITLVENIFKHGDFTDKERIPKVDISIQENTLLITTENRQKQNIDNRGLGSGLSNISTRLKHTYGDGATFSYGLDDRKCFKVKLSIFIEG
ncbi:sensor histidine kinase [Pedobacter jeongneungensis]|uniref:sensor histidine kinase n=1 Tax=Pedobacter jeongneungensis TaxID=947309 RepID=UPI00046A15C7|nr:histidine kinase [Pedobacter jeongneungensis]